MDPLEPEYWQIVIAPQRKRIFTVILENIQDPGLIEVVKIFLTVYSESPDKPAARGPVKEAAICTNGGLILHYIRDVIRGPWPEAEAVLDSKPFWRYCYDFFLEFGHWPDPLPEWKAPRGRCTEWFRGWLVQYTQALLVGDLPEYIIQNRIDQKGRTTRTTPPPTITPRTTKEIEDMKLEETKP